MKKVMILMNVFMGLIMSFILSLVGTLLGMRDNFNIMSWLMSFGISFVISLVIGFLVPIKKLGDGACGKLKIPPQSFKGTLVSAAISDLIYTPAITVIMVISMLSIAKKMAPPEAQDNIPPIGKALGLSLLVCLVAGYIVIVIIQPLLLRALMKNVMKKGGRPPEGRPPEQ